MPARRPCLDCPNLAEPGQARCATCHATRSRTISRARGSATARGYGTDWQKYARRAIRGYRARHGDVCPGWQRGPHPIDPKSWCCDHDLGPMCRSCNARKAATTDKQRAAERRRAWQPPQP